MRLVNRLGWKLVARAIPVPHVQALRLTIEIAQKMVEKTLDLGRGMEL